MERLKLLALRARLWRFRIESVVLGVLDIALQPSAEWRQWRTDRLDRQIAEAPTAAELALENAELDLEIAQLRQEIKDRGGDPDAP